MQKTELSKNLNLEMELEYDGEERMVYISDFSTTPNKYKCDTLEELMEIIRDYVENYIAPTKEVSNEIELEK